MREETQQESPRYKHGARARHRTVAAGSRRPTTTTITTGSSTAAGSARWPLRARARLLARPPCTAHRVLSTRGSTHTAFDTGTMHVRSIPHTLTLCLKRVCAKIQIGQNTNSYRTKLGALVLTSALPATGLGQAATFSKTVCSHTHRTSMARCVLLRSVRSTPIGNNTLTIRTFLFSLRS